VVTVFSNRTEEGDMDATEFETGLKRDGYQEIETKKVPANITTKPHSHDFSVRALILAGDITLTYEGQSRTFRVGDIFEMQAGCVHHEQYGPEGTTYRVGRRS
jgi:quercetin dioxygenase-like cupin family protein